MNVGSFIEDLVAGKKGESNAKRIRGQVFLRFSLKSKQSHAIRNRGKLV